MLLRKVYLGSHLSFSYSRLHFNVILVTFQMVAFKEISTPNYQNQQLVLQGSWRTSHYYIPYFPTDNAHLTYNAHPKLFYIPFEVQITRT